LTVNEQRGIIFVMTTVDFNETFPAQNIISASSLTVNLPRAPKHFYRQGWQSWSLTAWTDLTPLPVQKPTILHSMQVDPVYAHEPRPHGSWVGAVEFDGGEILLLGSLGLDAHVLLNGNTLEGKYETGNGEWFIAHGDEGAAFSKYAAELGKRFGTKTDKPAPRVWCSWYSLYTAIDEKLLYRTFDKLGDLPFDVLQVDDGWQISVGDWESNSKFPSGMKSLADKIKSTGRIAGLWLAPLIAVNSSRLFREHPDWFLRAEGGRFVSAGFNWGQQLYALDTTHPEVLKWLSVLMKQVRTWGFDYLKLDFLYGGALPGKRYNNMPREAAYRQGLKTMKEAMGEDAYLLTCGTPVITSLGLCDAMRLGADVSAEWENERDSRLLYNMAIPGTKNAIRTTTNRLWLSSLVQPDPDVAYFRSMECLLNTEHKSLLQDLALVCGFKATSDLPQWLNDDERESLRAFLESKPKVRQLSRCVYQVDERVVDFSSAMELPEKPKGVKAIQAASMGWLANHSWALKINDKLEKEALEKMKKTL
jgi:alpha-galactosidase